MCVLKAAMGDWGQGSRVVWFGAEVMRPLVMFHAIERRKDETLGALEPVTICQHNALLLIAQFPFSVADHINWTVNEYWLDRKISVLCFRGNMKFLNKDDVNLWNSRDDWFTISVDCAKMCKYFFVPINRSQTEENRYRAHCYWWCTLYTNLDNQKTTIAKVNVFSYISTFYKKTGRVLVFILSNMNQWIGFLFQDWLISTREDWQRKMKKSHPGWGVTWPVRPFPIYRIIWVILEFLSGFRSPSFVLSDPDKDLGRQSVSSIWYKPYESDACLDPTQ